MTESLAGRKEKQRRVGETEEEGRKEERRKEKSEDEGDGKSKVKPVTEWAWVVAVRKWMLGSGEEDKRWEVTKNRVGRNDRLGSGLGVKGSKAEERKREEVAKDRVGRNDRLFYRAICNH